MGGPPGILSELAGISWWGDLSGSLDIGGGGTCLDEEMVGKWRLHGYAAARLRGCAATRLRGYAATRPRGYAATRLHGYAATQLSGLALFWRGLALL